MHTFRVWAPTPKVVELDILQQRIPMAREDGGWWRVDMPTLAAGSDYGFILDGEGPYPDPRSPWQPEGVNGLSRPVIHKNFTWSDAGWQAPPLSSAIIYEMHVGTFTPKGTFDAAVERLDYLVELGVTHVEIMPVNEFSGEHGWGYDGVGLFAPQHSYGPPEGLKRLVEACHLKRLAVILDVVYNHFGPVGNYWMKFGPYQKTNFSTPWGPAINYDDAGSDEVRRFFCDNALMWLRDYHFDGLRLDALHAIVDSSPEPFIEQLADEVKKLEAELGRHLFLIAESDRNDPKLLWPKGRGGYALHAHWNDDFHHALHTVLTGERKAYYSDFGSMADLCKAFRQAYVYDGKYSPFRNRRHGRPPTGLDGFRFLAYLQNHDQIGNRALGERSSHLLSMGHLKSAAALVLMSPFIPMLFQGEEWGATSPFLYFSNHQDPELGNAVREGRRREFPDFNGKEEEIPDPQAVETFQRSKLIWNEITNPRHTELLDWHKKLIRLRKKNASLCDGRLDFVNAHCDDKERSFVLERGQWTVACNFGNTPLAVPLREGAHEVVATSDENFMLTSNSITLPADSVTILKVAE